MILNNIFKFVKGYVILYVMGKNAERFLYICARRGISVYDVCRTEEGVRLTAAAADFKKMRQPAYKAHVKIRIKQRCGLWFLIKRYRKRYFLLGGFALFAAWLAVSSLFIREVCVIGASRESVPKILEACRSVGVYGGALKSRLDEPYEIKNTLMNRIDGVAWIWVDIKGSRAYVTVREERKKPFVLDKSEPCSVVAAKDGFIAGITAKKGESLCASGEAVLKGDVIISGILGNDEGIYDTVHAMGEVWAYTYYEKSGEYEQIYRSERKTGSKKTELAFEFGEHTLKLRSYESPPFESCVTEESSRSFFGLEVKKTVFYETEVSELPISEAAAAELAGRELEKQIAEELLPSSEKISEELRTEQTENGTLRVTLEMSFLENIGVQAPLEPLPRN